MVELDEVINFAVALVAIYIFIIVMQDFWPLISDSFGNMLNLNFRDVFIAMLIAVFLYGIAASSSE